MQASPVREIGSWLINSRVIIKLIGIISLYKANSSS